MEVKRKTLEDIQRMERKNHKSTNTYSIQKGRKIQSGDRCIRTCYWRSSILGTRRKIETNCVFIKNNTDS